MALMSFDIEHFFQIQIFVVKHLKILLLSFNGILNQLSVFFRLSIISSLEFSSVFFGCIYFLSSYIMGLIIIWFFFFLIIASFHKNVLNIYKLLWSVFFLSSISWFTLLIKIVLLIIATSNGTYNLFLNLSSTFY